MNKKYGEWLVLSDDKIHRDGKVYLLCKCSCGELREVILKNLKSGISKSCGCVGRSVLTERNTKHGLRFTKTWRAWQAMKNRCYNKNFAHYYQYGGRGISVCDAWRNDFMAFYKEVGDAPPDKTLDRIDTNGNYEPGNVRWATRIEQNRNKRNNNKICGVCITQISKDLGGGHALVAKRLKRGWSVGRATSEKTHANAKN